MTYLDNDSIKSSAMSIIKYFNYSLKLFHITAEKVNKFIEYLWRN
jgi:hypothetical protein